MFSGTLVSTRILIESLEAGDRLEISWKATPRCRAIIQSKCSNEPKQCLPGTQMKLLFKEEENDVS